MRNSYLLLLVLAFILVAPFSALSQQTITGLPADDGLDGIVEKGAPLLRIAYVASTRGELYPCATCGTNSLGGLSRRATILKDLKAGNVPFLYLAGSEEFLSDLDTKRLTSPEWNKNAPINLHNESQKARRLVTGHSRLGTSVGYLLPEESDWLIEYAGKIPPGFQKVASEPVSTILSTPHGKVGIVLFPKGTENNGLPSEAQIQAVLDTGKSLRDKASLIIGISPWGNVGEYRFIPKADGIYSILFGGGNGLSYTYSTEFSTSSLLWVRSEFQGRAVNFLDIYEMPAPGHLPSWQEGISFIAGQTFLFLRLPPDQGMEKAIGKSADEWRKKP